MIVHGGESADLLVSAQVLRAHLTASKFATMDSQESRVGSTHITAEFEKLRERAVQLFSGMHNIPSFGKCQWQPYFNSVFDAYNRLWKFQQVNVSMTREKTMSDTQIDMRSGINRILRRNIEKFCSKMEFLNDGRSVKWAQKSDKSTIFSISARATEPISLKLGNSIPLCVIELTLKYEPE